MIIQIGNKARAGDLAMLISAQKKRFLFRLRESGNFHTHRGDIAHSELIGKMWGDQIYSHIGSPFLLLQPSLADLLLEIKRNTQIMYPKDIGFILITMSIGPGQHILEAGTGSGAFTTALAFAVGHQGHVTSYEVREDVHNLARKNLDRTDLIDRVTLKNQDITDGFDERDVDALFFDLPNPYDYMHHAHQALKPGGSFGCILPTTNQVSKALVALRQENFANIDVCEVLIRYYRVYSDRLRPQDRMIAHTGYLLFARAVQSTSNTSEIEV
jgi:tRNA (adenine57-N1/adenine58-N1)-methyltransferase